jgi:hypothetical protein
MLGVAACTASTAQEIKQTGFVTIKVTDELMGAVTNAEVRFVERSSKEENVRATDRAGSAVVELVPGDYDVFVTSKGFQFLAMHFGEVRPGEHRKLNAVLKVWRTHVGGSLSSGPQSAQASLLELKSGQMVGRFSTSGKTVVASVVELAYRYQLPMAVEYADRDATTRPLNLEFHNQSVRRILEAIVRQAPHYRVSFSNGIVDIFSPEAREDASNLLNVAIKDFSVIEMETREADCQLFCALSHEVNSAWCGGSVAVGQWEPVRITLHLQNAKVYEVLNAIVAQNGRAIWTVTASPEKRSNLQSGGIWYIYPLQQPFAATASERLARMQR